MNFSNKIFLQNAVTLEGRHLKENKDTQLQDTSKERKFTSHALKM